MDEDVRRLIDDYARADAAGRVNNGQHGAAGQAAINKAATH